MKPINLQLVSTMPNKALILAAAVSFAGFTLAGCSRNPKPGTDETGRADTTVVRDTISRPRMDTVTQVTPPAPTPNPQGVDTSMRHDTSYVPSPPPPVRSDTMQPNSNMPADSAHVPSSARPYHGDSAAVNHSVPDTTNKPADTTGHH